MSDTVLNLSVNIQKLSELEFVESISKKDLFLAAQINSNVTSSYSINIPALGAYSLDGIEKREKFVPNGQWNFTGLSAMINIPTSAVVLSNDVPNLKYLYESLISKLDELSVQLYSNYPQKQYLPSYIGMVILGNNFDSIGKVQQIYGSHTNWKKISGRFLFGAGSPESNNYTTYGSSDGTSVPAKKYGGVKETELNGLPKHLHAFPDTKVGKLPERDIDFGVSPDKSMFEEKTKKLRAPGGESVYNSKHGLEAFDHTSGNTLLVKKTVKTKFSPPDSIEKEFKFKAQGEILGNDSWINKPHNNIPPYYTTYIWERIS